MLFHRQTLQVINLLLQIDFIKQVVNHFYRNMKIFIFQRNILFQMYEIFDSYRFQIFKISFPLLKSSLIDCSQVQVV